jgi:hypothetical protein
MFFGAEASARQNPAADKTDPTGASKANLPPPAADPLKAIAESLMPPQHEGAARRLFSTGSPASQQRLNVAMRVLQDPVARSSFTRVYSGQARNWSR